MKTFLIFREIDGSFKPTMEIVDETVVEQRLLELHEDGGSYSANETASYESLLAVARDKGVDPNDVFNESKTENPFIAKTSKKAIEAERDRRQLSAGFFADGNWFRSDAQFRSYYLGLLFALQAKNFPLGIILDTLDGGSREVTPALVLEIFEYAKNIENLYCQITRQAFKDFDVAPETFDMKSIIWPRAHWDK